MRIIAGERRGHRIDGPKGRTTRPTSDLVRESLFNILRGSIEGLVVVDLFAGTGALGLEALSRGAARAIFVEQNRQNVALIYRNLSALRYEDRVRVLATDAYRWVRSFVPVDSEPMVVLIDPPYREYQASVRRVTTMLGELVRKLPPDSVIALESSRELEDSVLPDPTLWDTRRYGRTQISIRPVSASDGMRPTEDVADDQDHDEPVADP